MFQMIQASVAKSMSEKHRIEKERHFLRACEQFNEIVMPQIDQQIYREVENGLYATSICFDFSKKEVKQVAKLAANEVNFFIEDIPELENASNDEIKELMDKLIQNIESNGYIVNCTSYNQKIYRLIIFWG